MVTSDVFQCLINAEVAHSAIERMLNDALETGEGHNDKFKVINTNSGMPAEFRIERV